MPGLDVAFLVIVTTSVRLLLSGDCTVLICESALLCIFKPELSVTQVFALAHFVSQSGPAWHVELRRLRQSRLRAISSRATAGPKKGPCHQQVQADIPHCNSPTLRQKFGPRSPRAANFRCLLVRSRQKLGWSKSSRPGAEGSRPHRRYSPTCLWLEIQAASLDRLMSSAAEELQSRLEKLG